MVPPEAVVRCVDHPHRTVHHDVPLAAFTEPILQQHLQLLTDAVRKCKAGAKLSSTRPMAQPAAPAASTTSGPSLVRVSERNQTCNISRVQLATDTGHDRWTYETSLSLGRAFPSSLVRHAQGELGHKRTFGCSQILAQLTWARKLKAPTTEQAHPPQLQVDQD